VSRPSGRTAAAALWLAIGGAGAARGQQPDSTPHPPLLTRADTLRADSLHRDSLARDTAAAMLPVYPAAGAPGPLPLGTRYVFSADSLVFSNITTLSDLLAHIPGVYVVRGGYYGQAEPVMYGGRGAQALEVYWDGVPYLPVGRDSVWLDPARIPLAPIGRVEVVVLPGVLRVYLITACQRSTLATTDIRITTGVFSTAEYRADFAKRWHSGAGLSLGADWNNSNGDAGTTTTVFSATDLWLRGEYIPTPRLGTTFEIVASAWDRDASTSSATVHPWKSKRNDSRFRAFWGNRSDGLGLRVEALIASTTVSQDTAIVARSTWEDVLDISNTWTRGEAGVTATLGEANRRWRFDAHGAWTPLPFLTVAADARHSTYTGGREGNRAHVAGGLSLPFGFSARAEYAWTRDLQAPTLASDKLQRTSDLSGALRWDHKAVTIELGGARRSAYVPIGFEAGIASVQSLGPVPTTTYATARASIRPLPGVELSGWYFNPLTGGADFEPPYHARYSVTFYSKFWRVFKSGAFALRGEVAAESWSRSAVGGVDSLAGQLPLRPGTFVETNLEMRIVGFTAFWIIRNSNAMRASYVVGADYPKSVQIYGVRWTFTN